MSNPVDTTPVSHGAPLSSNPAYPPSRTRGLRPPFRKGEPSANPSGLTKDGRSPARVKLERALADEIDKSGGMHALAKRWVAQAKKGNPVALAKIIDRLYPLEQQQGGAQVVHVGVRLEPTPGSASVSIAVSTSKESYGGPAALPPHEDQGPRDVELEESPGEDSGESSDSKESPDSGAGESS